MKSTDLEKHMSPGRKSKRGKKKKFFVHFWNRYLCFRHDGKFNERTETDEIGRGHNDGVSLFHRKLSGQIQTAYIEVVPIINYEHLPAEPLVNMPIWIFTDCRNCRWKKLAK